MRGSQSVKNLHSRVPYSPLSKTTSQPFFMHSIMKPDDPPFLVKTSEIP